MKKPGIHLICIIQVSIINLRNLQICLYLRCDVYALTTLNPCNNESGY